MSDAASLAQLSEAHELTARFWRILGKEGVTLEQVGVPMNDRKARRNLALFLAAGCPDSSLAATEKAALTVSVRSGKPVVSLISHGKDVVIFETDGSENLVRATDVFCRIEPDFRSSALDVVSFSKPATTAQVYQIQRNAHLRQVAEELGIDDLNDLCFTQSQIREFVKARSTHARKWIHASGNTKFLFKEEGRLFVASVSMFSGTPRPSLRVRECIDDGFNWFGRYLDRFVVPEVVRRG